jgi:choline dehydrogenase-like flavoprotein
MPVIDLMSEHDLDTSSVMECEVCIVGSGPAGSTLARELSDTALRVTLLESGGFSRSPEADALNDIENIGRQREIDQWHVRNRIVGGSSHTWGGRCAPFDAIDFERRSWVPWSGWPIDLAQIEPYLDRTIRHLGLLYGSGFSDDRFWAISGRRKPQEPSFQGVLPFFWQFSRDDEEAFPFEYMRFGRRLQKYIGANVTLVTGATVLRVNPVEALTAVQSVDFAGPDGRKYILNPRIVVLCSGGIDNARLLLSSNTLTRNGLGNDKDNVGRYLMDHIRGPVGSFDLANSQGVLKRFGRYSVGKNLFRAGLRLSPEIQQSEGLLNCAAWLGEVVGPDDPWDALRRILRRQPNVPSDFVNLLRNADLFFRSSKDFFIERNGIRRKLKNLDLMCMCEQQPNPDSRVILSDRKDRFGSRLACIDWRISDEEPRTLHRMAELVSEQMVRMGFPAPGLSEWVRQREALPSDFLDVAHPTGTTRMSDDPATGVVDRDGQVHGIAGLYVAGSSTFPTAGHCNPTQMIVALAVRLADHIKTKTNRAPLQLRADRVPLLV